MYRQNPHVRAYLDHGSNQLGMIGLSLLAAADRQLHVRTVIAPALEAGTWVLCDRYVYSSYAFFAARGVSLEFVRHINVDVPPPDVTFLLDVPAETALARVRARDGCVLKFEERSGEFMRTVRDMFLSCADETFVIIDARQSEQVVAQQIAAHIEQGWVAEYALSIESRPHRSD
jgi:dTMP kinase